MTEESPAQKPNPRRHDLDALRAFAMLIGVGLHAALAYMPNEAGGEEQTVELTLAFFVMGVHGFRMPVFFVMSGFFTAMLWRRRGLFPLLEHRFKRILIPFLLGCVTIVPLINFINPYLYEQAIEESKRGATPTYAQKAGGLWEAAATGNLAAIQQLTASGADLNALEPETGATPLTIAVWTWKNGAAEALLKAGANPNARNRDLSTALHSAALFGNADIMRQLLDAGGDPDLRMNDGSTPRDALKADRKTTEFVAVLVQTRIDWDKTTEGRRQIEAMLNGGGPSSVSRLLESAVSFAFSVSFHHLWFLWFLCVLVLIFAAYARLFDKTGWRIKGGAWIHSPIRYLWLIPLTMIPQWWMNEYSYGPDTYTSILLPWHLVAYYAIFFGFGAVYYDCGDEKGRVGKWWLLTIPLAVVLFPLGVGATYEYKELGLPEEWRRPLTDLLQVSYTWLMTFGLMGLFRRLLQRERFGVRYMSDATYWLYLAHLPLVLIAQYWAGSWDWNPFFKFLFACVFSTGVVMLTYEAFVRYTWVGAMLNGRKTRPSRADAAPVSE